MENLFNVPWPNVRATFFLTFLPLNIECQLAIVLITMFTINILVYTVRWCFGKIIIVLWVVMTMITCTNWKFLFHNAVSTGWGLMWGLEGWKGLGGWGCAREGGRWSKSARAVLSLSAQPSALLVLTDFSTQLGSGSPHTQTHSNKLWGSTFSLSTSKGFCLWCGGDKVWLWPRSAS